MGTAGWPEGWSRDSQAHDAAQRSRRIHFHDLTVDALVGTVGWALSVWRDRPEHILAMRRRTMVRDWSWHRAGAEYERLYLEAYARRRGHAFRG